MARRVTHRALDGTRIRLTGDHDLSRPYTSVARIANGGRLHEIHGGPRDSVRAWAHEIGVRRFDEEFRLHGGRLRVGRAVGRDSATGVTDRLLGAVWEGRGHAVFAHLYHAGAKDAVAFFHALRPADHDDGVTVVPQGRSAFAEPADLVKEVPGLGLLEITPLTTTAARRLPPWRGAAVAGGELFQDSVEGQGTYFLLATATSLVTVLPDGDEQVRRLPGRLAGLTIETVD